VKSGSQSNKLKPGPQKAIMFASRFQALIPARTLIAVALCLGLLATACDKKPVRTTPPVLVPSIEAEPQPAPPPQPAATPNPAPEPAPAATPSSDEQKPKPKPHKPAPRKPVQPTPAEPAKPEPAKPEPAKPAPGNSAQITAAVPRAAVQSQMQETEQLLRNSQGRLAGINRSLSDSEQGMLRQAHNYIAQSNQALQSGDIERAFNLAVKANLLTNELAK
jgi:outer membrane biosynthesis protein TonB